MATRGISGAARPFPNVGTLKDIGAINNYLNSLGGWLQDSIGNLNKQAKVIPYAAFADLPPLAGPPRFIAVPDDPTYGQVICFNGVSTSGTDTAWYRLIPAGTAGGPSATLPAGGTTSQVLGKVNGTDYAMAWQTPHYVPAGGTASQALRKTSGTDYAAAWSDVHEVPAGGGSGDVLSKSGTADYALTWATPHYLTAGGTTGQVLAKTSNTDYAAAWSDTARPAFVGALIYSTSTQTLTSAVDARASFTSSVYDLGTFFSTASPTRLTVGTGITYVELTANVAFVDGVLGVPGTRHCDIWKNGSAMGTALAQENVYGIGTGDTVVLNVRSAPLAVGSGDYFEMNVGQASGTAATIAPAGATWFSLKVLK